MLSSEASSKIARFARSHSNALLFDEQSATLMDVFSAKTVSLLRNPVARIAEKTNSQTGQSYVVLVREDGSQLVLAEAGLAFAPSTRNTGPLPDLPNVVCMRDLRGATDQLGHMLYGHPDSPPGQDAVTLVMFCLAVLDGAQDAGLDVSGEARQVEQLLEEIEKKAPRSR